MRYPIIDTTTYADCVGECTCIIKFSDLSIPQLEIKYCVSTAPQNESDLNNDGIDEVGIMPTLFSGCWHQYHIWTFKNGKWKEIIEPIDIQSCLWKEENEIIKKDPNKLGNVIINYNIMSDLVNHDEMILRTKSVLLRN